MPNLCSYFSIFVVIFSNFLGIAPNESANNLLYYSTINLMHSVHHLALPALTSKLPNGHMFINLPSTRRRNSMWKVRQDLISFESRIHA